jgi:NitT/TauT family transport system substrate-binding protein
VRISSRSARPKASARDDFFPRAAVEPDKIVGLDTIVKDAVAFKFTATELTKAQLDDLIKIPLR